MSDEHDQYAAGLIHLTRDFKIDVPATQDAIAARLRELTADLAAANKRAEELEVAGVVMARYAHWLEEHSTYLAGVSHYKGVSDEIKAAHTANVARVNAADKEVNNNLISAGWLQRAKEASNG